MLECKESLRFEVVYVVSRKTHILLEIRLHNFKIMNTVHIHYNLCNTHCFLFLSNIHNKKQERKCKKIMTWGQSACQ